MAFNSTRTQSQICKSVIPIGPYSMISGTVSRCEGNGIESRLPFKIISNMSSKKIKIIKKTLCLEKTMEACKASADGFSKYLTFQGCWKA